MKTVILSKLMLIGVVAATAFASSPSEAVTMTPKYSFPGGLLGNGPYAHLAATTSPTRTPAIGTVYGVTQFGGANATGEIFSYTVQLGPFGNEYESPVASLPPGGHPSGPLIRIPRASGEILLFGTTGSGGIYGKGSIYKYSSLTNTVTTVYSFSGTNCEGASPEGPLAAIANNSLLLVGTTQSGGCSGNGTIYTYNTGGLLTTVHSFSGFAGGDGSLPTGVIRAEPAVGNVVHSVYGVVSQGGFHTSLTGGYIFKYDAFNSQLSPVCEFTSNGNTGDRPMAELKLAPHPVTQMPTIFGTTGNVHSIYQCDVQSGALNFLHYFTSPPDHPSYDSPLVVDATQKKLYGTTADTIYSYDFTNASYSTIYQFPGGVFGSGAPGGLIPFMGSLWGVTPDGGGTSRGSIFKFAP